jgi:hypothetical protein
MSKFLSNFFQKVCGVVRQSLTVLLFVVLFSTTALADVPFQGYTYNFWGDLVPSPAAYVPHRSFVLADICPSLGDMFNPSDLFIDSVGNVYVVDSGNDRVVVFCMDLTDFREITGFWRDGEWDSFNRPNGIFVTNEMLIFVADTQNNRVVVLDENDEFVREIVAPTGEGIDEDFEFLPLSVLVDRGGRTFVIDGRVFEGIMSFNAQGDFLGYFGTIDVSFNVIDLLWRFVMTDEQRARQALFIPRVFQSMAIDEYGFVFTTHVENHYANNQVMRLNPRGEDVLVNFNDNVVINGDQGWRPAGPLSGPSVFVDVSARSHGMFTALCSIRGRLYTYDSEGNLIYVFSGTGTMQGMTRMPVAVETFGEDMFVLDAHGRGRIVHFTPTEYGRLINRAIALRYDGHERYAVDYWRQIVAMDENFALAWGGIGRSLLAMGYNARAMYYLERGMDTRYFSIAFRRNRMEVMQETLPTYLTGGMILLVIYTGFKIVRRVRKGPSSDENS